MVVFLLRYLLGYQEIIYFHQLRNLFCIKASKIVIPNSESRNTDVLANMTTLVFTGICGIAAGVPDGTICGDRDPYTGEYLAV